MLTYIDGPTHMHNTHIHAYIIPTYLQQTLPKPSHLRDLYMQAYAHQQVYKSFTKSNLPRGARLIGIWGGPERLFK